jgi:2-oxoglutarate dehydrogenase E2 component (dihydrolipoamide succinyltransferase)
MSIEVTIPQIGESVATVFIARWLRQPGEAVRAGEGIIELDSDKASMEVPAPVGGVLLEQLAAEGDEIAVGAPIARIDEGATVAATTSASSTAAAEAASPEAAESEVRAGPAARRHAQEEGVSLSEVSGSGPRGRVISSDVVSATTNFQAPVGSVPVPEVGIGESRTERVPMSPLRRTIARRLVEAQHTAAMLTTFNEVDMSGVMSLRKRHQDKFIEKYGHKVGFMSFFVKAVIEGLKKFPAINSEIDGNDIIYKNFYHIGVAVSGPKGLVVPVVRDADTLSFSGVELGIAELAGRARNNRLRLDDFKGGTFTISNGGTFGSMMSTPILNPPQVGILGMHNIIRRPVAVGDEIVIRPMMYLALTYDHRVVDGREAVGFLIRVKECIEAPERMLLEV